MARIDSVIAAAMAQANKAERAAGWLPGATGEDLAMRLRLRDDRTPADENCPECHGVGGYRLDLPVWHPRFGKFFECVCVVANREAGVGVAYRGGSGLLDAELSLTWAKLADTDALAPAIAAVRRVMLRGWGWVYLSGDYGTGKTLLLKTAVAETLRAGRGATYALQAELLRHLRKGFTSEDFDERLEAWRDARVLCLDEMGRANETGWTQEAQSLIFGPRYESALAEHKNITIYASNFGAAAMPEWLDSRLRDGRFEVVEVKGPDMRPLMGAED